MKKIVKAVLPYAFQGKPNFKQQPYNAWINIGGQIAKPHYPPKFFHGMAYHSPFHTSERITKKHDCASLNQFH